MPEFVRHLAAALGTAYLGIAMAAGGVLAQDKPAPPAAQTAPQLAAVKQIALTDRQIEGVLAAQKDIDAVTAKLPDDAKPDPKVAAQLEDAVKKNGFASYEEYNDVVDNIGMVLAGFDPATRKYVGTEAVIKAQIAQVEADKKMSANDRKQALDDLNEALKTPAPTIDNKANIDLVTKYYERLAAALGDDQE
ncbi:MAG: hypothetical protein NVSMB20_10430 [Bradyrhizobium sp.]